ncbi:hypothetical protein PanWU01x14_238640 [Parasponia andersonii]|uniref:Uncharacterized protein n=1 Tax=Parasponia andersonii TaxID=3476 RepID=A0A2P5BHE4_PARAD|nr:hypothetical protein PanWU01x14_238640 [Parasponia andersonii]
MVQLQSNRTVPRTVPEEAVIEGIPDLNLPLRREEEAINDQGNPPPEGEAVIEGIPDLNLPLSGPHEGEAVIEGIPDLNIPLSREEEAINDQAIPPPEGTI